MYQIDSVTSIVDLAVSKLKQPNFGNSGYTKSKASEGFDNKYSDILEDTKKNIFQLFNEI